MRIQDKSDYKIMMYDYRETPEPVVLVEFATRKEESRYTRINNINMLNS